MFVKDSLVHSYLVVQLRSALVQVVPLKAKVQVEVQDADVLVEVQRHFPGLESLKSGRNFRLEVVLVDRGHLGQGNLRGDEFHAILGVLKLDGAKLEYKVQYDDLTLHSNLA